MRKRSILSVIICALLILPTLLSASDFQITEFRVLHNDFKGEAEPVMDIDGQYCAVLRVDSDVPQHLTLDQKVYKREMIDTGEYYFYVSYREKEITFKAPNHNPLTVAVPNNGLIMGKVYYARLKSVEEGSIEPQPLPVLISSTPEGAQVLLNGEQAGITNAGFKLLPGAYDLILNKDGFATLKKTIEVAPAGDNIFQFNLVQLTAQANNPAAPEPDPNPGVVIFEDFENTNLDNWLRLSGTWDVAGGFLAQSSHDRQAGIITGNPDLKNYSIEFDAKKSDGGNGFNLILGTKMNNKDALVWVIGGWYNKTSALVSYTDYVSGFGNSMKATESRLTIETNRWYHIKVDITGSTVKCYLDKNLIIDYTDPEVALLTNGRIGFGTHKTKVFFDNLKVTRLAD